MIKKVPFKKEIDFDSIYQISSISLEHNLSLKEDNVVRGNFIISGSYKKTDSSINIDEFNYELPFEISIDSKYDTSNITVDINDFYYEVIDSQVLSLNIEVIIDNLEEKEVVMDTDIRKIDMDNEVLEDDTNSLKNDEISENVMKENEREVVSIFDGLDCNEKYVTYKIHVMGENDTVESILKKYDIKKSVLEDYNNLMDLKIGDKIIIPTND